MENKKIIWRDEITELNNIPVIDIDIAYDRIYGKLEILAYDENGMPKIQKYGQWCSAISDHYIPLQIENAKNGELYNSSFLASWVKAYYNHLKGLDYEEIIGHEPSFKFNTLTQHRLKEKNVELNVEDVIDFGSNVIQKYAVANLKTIHKEDSQDTVEELKDYYDAKERYLCASGQPDIYTEEEIAEEKLKMKKAEKEYNDYCEKFALHNFIYPVEFDEEFQINSGDMTFLIPDMLAKTIYHSKNKEKSTEYHSTTTKPKTKNHEETKTL